VTDVLLVVSVSGPSPSMVSPLSIPGLSNSSLEVIGFEPKMPLPTVVTLGAACRNILVVSEDGTGCPVLLIQPNTEVDVVLLEVAANCEVEFEAKPELSILNGWLLVSNPCADENRPLDGVVLGVNEEKVLIPLFPAAVPNDPEAEPNIGLDELAEPPVLNKLVVPGD